MQLTEATPVLPADKDLPTTAARSTELRYELSTPWYAQRRAFRIIVLLLLLNIIAITSITWGPLTARAWQDWRAARQAAEAQAAAAAAQAQAAAAKLAAHKTEVAAQQATIQQAMSLSLPAEQVVYTEDSGEAARLLADGK